MPLTGPDKTHQFILGLVISFPMQISLTVMDCIIISWKCKVTIFVDGLTI